MEYDITAAGSSVHAKQLTHEIQQPGGLAMLVGGRGLAGVVPHY